MKRKRLLTTRERRVAWLAGQACAGRAPTADEMAETGSIVERMPERRRRLASYVAHRYCGLLGARRAGR